MKCPECGSKLKLKEAGKNYNHWLCDKCGYELLEFTKMRYIDKANIYSHEQSVGAGESR